MIRCSFCVFLILLLLYSVSENVLIFPCVKKNVLFFYNVKLIDEFQEKILENKQIIGQVLDRMTNIDNVLVVLELEESATEENPILIVHPKYLETLPKEPIQNSEISHQSAKPRNPPKKASKQKKAPKKLSCDICGKNCVNKFKLDLHVNSVHLNKKPHKCSQCEFATAIKSNLTKHVRLKHEGKKPVKCNICHQDFAEESSLKHHIARVHDKVVHTCTYCDKAFGGKSNMERHIKNIHNV